MTDRPLCIYHAPCFDGFGAAWVVHHAYDGEADFWPGVYGQPPPDVTGRSVIVVDFSYPRSILERMHEVARSLIVLDHHKTAADELADVPFAVFDFSRSGAGLAWDYCFPGKPRPALIDYIEDRDLWRFALLGSRFVHAALSSYAQDFGLWDSLMYKPIDDLLRDGEILDRKQQRDVETLVRILTRSMTIGGHVVPVANLPFPYASDAAHALAQNQPFAACYVDTPTGRAFSLRSSSTGLDVSAIAKAYGGGGHVHAAGFEAPRGWEGDS